MNSKSCIFCGTLFYEKPRRSSNFKKQKYCKLQCFKDHLSSKSEEFFWARVNKDGPNGCWVWTGYTQRFGHGWIGRSKGGKAKGMLAHRFAWTLLCGPLKPEECLLHRCDNPPCVNPAHLFKGDREANSADSVAKDRHARGERSRHAKLRPEQVMEIRQRFRYYAPRKTNADELAPEYGVLPGTIYLIGTGRTWRHLPMPRTTAASSEGEPK